MTKHGLAVGILLLLLPACGGKSSSSSTPVTTPPPPAAACTQTVLFQGSGPVPTRTLVQQSFSVGTAGRLDVVMDWTDPTSPVGVYVTPTGQCSLDQFNASSCSFLLRSETLVKPRKASVPSIAPGNYDLLIANFAAKDESVSVQLILSSTTCPPLALAGGAGAFSSAARAPLAARRWW